MPIETPATARLLMIVTPSFNLAATMGFIDVFRAVNYLEGAPRFSWVLASLEGGEVVASNAVSVRTVALKEAAGQGYGHVVVSSSWTPERFTSARLLAALNRLAKTGAVMGALDTGAFLLAEAGLLDGDAAAVHYEHWDSFREMYPAVKLKEELFVFSERRFSCCGGLAATDAALHIASQVCGPAMAQAAARYIFCDHPRPPGTPQNPAPAIGAERAAPGLVREAIALMELHIEAPLAIPEICARLGVSHRQLDRLFGGYTGMPPALFYRDLRLGRARGLVTQTDLPLSEVAVATGFASQVHFSTSYRKRFGLPPSADRVQGRIPFEFRAKPLFRHMP